ncbi:MAG: tripartite tricarboxylate transporter substrate binding protein [Betaproteobacteria bacterium]|nr:tripartite tricarboxylate transporter substrate binding protein [Betaproteobacteria bacterium]
MRRSASVLVLALAALSPLAWAQSDYPTRPISVSVGYPAGGGTDLLTRLLAAEVGKMVGREVIVVNQPGASGTVAMSALAAAKPDGYTLGVTASSSLTIAPFTLDSPPDLLERITTLAAVGRLRNGFLVKSASPFKDIKEVIEFARKNPGKVSIGVQGMGSSGALALGATGIQENINWTLVPFKGEAPALSAVLGGHITAATSTSGAWARFVEAGTLRLIASMDAERFDSVPNAPTMVEQGYPNSSLIFVLAGPKGLPPAVIKRITDAFTEAMHARAYVEFTTKNGMLMKKPLTGEALKRYLMDDRATMGAIAAKMGLNKK